MILKSTRKVLSILLCISLAFSVCACGNSKEKKAYNDAIALLKAGKYVQAERAFTSLGDYENSKIMVSEAKYQGAQAMLKAGDYYSAEEAFTSLGDYRDSVYMVEDVKKAKTYSDAEQAFQQKDFDTASMLFSSLGEYRDSKQRVEEAKNAKTALAYENARALLDSGKYDEAIEVFSTLDNNNASEQRIAEAIEAKNAIIYSKAIELLLKGEATEAYKLFSEIKEYEDVAFYLDKFEPILVSKLIFWDNGNEDTYKYNYSYDDNGLLQQITVSEIHWDNKNKNHDGKVIIMSFFYDGRNNLEKVISTSNDNWIREENYDRDRHLIKLTITNPKGIIISSNTYENEVINGVLRKRICYETNTYTKKETVVVYDEHGNMTKNEEYHNVEYINTYDDDGRLAKVNSSYDSGDSGEANYKYDKFGNLIEIKYSSTTLEGYTQINQYEYRYKE